MARIVIDKLEDRVTIAGILVKNKYTVSMGSMPQKGKRSYAYYIEYTPNEEAQKGGDQDETDS